MSTEVLTVQEGITVEEALKILINNRITGMPVVNDKGKMIGVLSEFDLIQQISSAGGSKSRIFKKPATFSKVVDAVPENTPLDKIIERFDYRAVGPLFDTAAFDVCGRVTGPTSAELWTDCAGRLTMRASLAFRPAG